jgi:response regulator of citrate/malate metabolism
MCGLISTPRPLLITGDSTMMAYFVMLSSNSHFDLEMGFGAVGRPAQWWHGD